MVRISRVRNIKDKQIQGGTARHLDTEKMWDKDGNSETQRETDRLEETESLRQKQGELGRLGGMRNRDLQKAPCWPFPTQLVETGPPIGRVLPALPEDFQ